MEKVLVTLPEKFESNIFSVEESKDLNKIILGELINVLLEKKVKKDYKMRQVY